MVMAKLGKSLHIFSWKYIVSIENCIKTYELLIEISEW
jgi:hypothetical protein